MQNGQNPSDNLVASSVPVIFTAEHTALWQAGTEWSGTTTPVASPTEMNPLPEPHQAHSDRTLR
jgi:hypothetical protein